MEAKASQNNRVCIVRKLFGKCDSMKGMRKPLEQKPVEHLVVHSLQDFKIMIRVPPSVTSFQILSQKL